MSKKIILLFLFLTAAVIGIYSCQDYGSEPISNSNFSVSDSNAILNKGSLIQITISGGLQPYSIKKQPNNSIATASLNSSTLTIAGVDTGSTSTMIADSKSPVGDSLQINISVTDVISLISYSNQIQPIFNSQCTVCHGAQGGLSLNAGTSYQNLVNVNAQSSCTSLKRVLPGDAGNSVLYRKISGSTCGSMMPQGSSLSSGDISLVRDWINQGANRN